MHANIKMILDWNLNETSLLVTWVKGPVVVLVDCQ